MKQARKTKAPASRSPRSVSVGTAAGRRRFVREAAPLDGSGVAGVERDATRMVEFLARHCPGGTFDRVLAKLLDKVASSEHRDPAARAAARDLHAMVVRRF